MSYTLSLKLPELTDSNFLTSNWWRVMFAIPIIPAIIRIVSFLKFYKSDTPNYLVQNGREDEAQNRLAEMYQPQYVEEELNLLKAQK